MSKNILSKIQNGILAAAVFAPMLISKAANAAALGTDEFYGGAVTGDEFADAAGLSAGDLPTTIASIIRVSLGFLGIVAVVIILMGGFKWMTSGGNDDKVKSAKKVMISGVIGLVIVLSAFAISSFVIQSILTATS